MSDDGRCRSSWTTRSSSSESPWLTTRFARREDHQVGHRGRTGDPLYGIRKALRTAAILLTSRQTARIEAVFADHAQVAVQMTWAAYVQVIDAYRQPLRAEGNTLMGRLIDALARGVPAGLDELRVLGRTLARRRSDILAYFDHPGSSNGPTEAINGRLEHLRGTALGFRHLTNYIARALLDTGGFRPRLHSLL